MLRVHAAFPLAGLVLAIAPAAAGAAKAGTYYGTSASSISVTARGTAIKAFEVACFKKDLGGRTFQAGTIYLAKSKRVPINRAGRFSYAGNAYLRILNAPPGTQVKATISGSFSGERVKGRFSITPDEEAWACRAGAFSGKLWKGPPVTGGA